MANRSRRIFFRLNLYFVEVDPLAAHMGPHADDIALVGRQVDQFIFAQQPA